MDEVERKGPRRDLYLLVFFGSGRAVLCCYTYVRDGGNEGWINTASSPYVNWMIDIYKTGTGFLFPWYLWHFS